MNTVYLLIGGNLGDRSKNLSDVKKILQSKIGKITQSSSLYETAAWGLEEQPGFLNQVLIIKTNLSPQEIMQKILLIENDMGRIRTKKNAPRTIDIDILFFNNEIITKPKLLIPHPEILNRRFVLVPLNEISPKLVHPHLKKSIKKLLSECSDPLDVKLLSSP